MLEVFAEFSSLISTPCVMAGGAVRDHLLGREPRDFDLFVFDAFDHSPLSKFRRIVPHWTVGYGTSRVTTYEWLGVEVQIVRWPGTSDVESLLGTFDWNVCLFAYDGREFTKRMDERDIRAGKPLRLQFTEDPNGTLRRGYRFAERFRMVIDPGALRRLCRSVAADAERQLMAA
jgi:hypothetical protein